MIILLTVHRTGVFRMLRKKLFLQCYWKGLLNICSICGPKRHLCLESSWAQKNRITKFLDHLVDQKNHLTLSEQVQNLIILRKEVEGNLLELKELDALTKDEKLKCEAKKEGEMYSDKLKEVDETLINLLVPFDEVESCNSIVLEVSAGIGGQEAMLFAKDLFETYQIVSGKKGFNLSLVESETTDLGGIRRGTMFVSGLGVYSFFKFESGVHRVQRVPKTEKSGRIHTSTVSVAILPEPTDINVLLKEKDLIIETKRASGPGGQHVNKTDSAVRITHTPSGLVVESQTERSQPKNKQIALKKLSAKLYQIQLESQISERRSLRKSQVGTKGRSEKVRTYNFNQDRITDHRLSSNFSGLQFFFEGGPVLESIISKLQASSREEEINDFIENYQKSV